MSALLLVPLAAMTVLASRIPAATAQGTGAVCQSGFEWVSCLCAPLLDCTPAEDLRADVELEGPEPVLCLILALYSV